MHLKVFIFNKIYKTLNLEMSGACHIPILFVAMLRNILEIEFGKWRGLLM